MYTPQLHTVVVDLYFGEFLSHAHAPLPLVCTGCAHYSIHESLFDGIARALQRVYPLGPFPRVGQAMTILVSRDGELCSRFDILINEQGAFTSVVSNDHPRYDLAPSPLASGRDCLSVAQGVFASLLSPAAREG
jgi:hypothetical protein